MQLFDCEDYKSYLTWKIKIDGQRAGYKGDLSKAAGCQQSYFSRVLNGHDHLTLDHAIGVTKFWGFGEIEAEYFVELVNLARAGTPGLQHLIHRRLKKMRSQSKNLTERFNKKDQLSLEHQNVYYSSWHWAAIHMALTIPTLRTAAELSNALGLDLRFVRNSLSKLKEMGLAVQKGETWHPGTQNVHLSRESPLLYNHLLNWRIKGTIDSQKSQDTNLHYTAIHSLSKKDFQAIQNILLTTLDKTRSIVEPSKEEVLVGFNLDWFLVS